MRRYLGRCICALAAWSWRRCELGVDDEGFGDVSVRHGGWHGDGSLLLVRHGDLNLHRVVFNRL